jgi:ATP-dependent Zn protease
MTDAVHAHCSTPWWRRPPVILLGIVAAGLVIFTIVEMAAGPAATPYGTFLDQLDAGNVASVTLQGTEIKGRYKQPLNTAAATDAAQANSFRSRMPDFGDSSLIPALRKQHVVIDVTSSSSWTRLLAGIPLPMLLFIGFILIAGIVRLVRGGKAQSGSAMPMHPMQGMIGLVSSLFSKQQKAADPPTQDGSRPKSE